MTQFVFYPKPHKLRCRGCKTELRYPTSGGTKAKYFLMGALGGFVMLPALLLLFFLIDDQTILWLSVGLVMVLQMVVAGYIEAAHVQKRYQPVRA